MQFKQPQLRRCPPPPTLSILATSSEDTRRAPLRSCPSLAACCCDSLLSAAICCCSCSTDSAELADASSARTGRQGEGEGSRLTVKLGRCVASTQHPAARKQRCTAPAPPTAPHSTHPCAAPPPRRLRPGTPPAGA
jgi:hypothetical protein